LFARPVRDVAQAARPEIKDNVLYVELTDSLKMAVSMLLEHKITALPVGTYEVTFTLQSFATTGEWPSAG